MGSNAGFMLVTRWKVPTGPFQIIIKIKISLSFIHKNDSSSVMYFIDGLVDVNETVHRLKILHY